MKVILCTHNSGGVGKTTLAVHLAGILARRGDVLLIDCDDQADSWMFFVGEEPSDNETINKNNDVHVITNPERISIKKKKKVNIEQYDYIVLDMDTPIPNIVQVIIGSEPDLIFIPINKSHKNKGSKKNLAATLDVVERMQGRVVKPIKVMIVPLGIEENLIREKIKSFPYKPNDLSVTNAMRDLDYIIEDAVYEDRQYIWEYNGYEDTQDYFEQLLDI